MSREWTALLAATDSGGGVLSMWDTTIEAPTVEAAYDDALKMQDWTPEKGGFLLSRLTATDGEDRLVIHDNNDPRKCWLS